MNLFKKTSKQMIKITYVLSTFFRNSDRKICDIFDFTAENSTNEGDCPKLSTDEIPVSTGLIDFLNQLSKQNKCLMR